MAECNDGVGGHSSSEPPPPTYKEATACGLKFEDFLPSNDEDSVASVKDWKFGHLMNMCNNWLRHRGNNISVKTCETIVYKIRYEYIQSERMSWHVSHSKRIHYAKGLRVWYVDQPCADERGYEQINYITVTPLQFSADDIEEPFESCSHLIRRVNTYIHGKPVGYIINMDATRVKCTSLGVDVESLYWSEAGMDDRSMSSSWTIVYCIIIFYMKGTVDSAQQLGYVDFCPDPTTPSDTHQSLVVRARQWCLAHIHHPIRCTNIQTLIGKVKYDCGLDSERMHYNNSPTNYASHTFSRFIRLWYIRLSSNSGTFESAIPVKIPTILNYTDFIPALSKTSPDLKKMEQLQSVGKRINAWVTRSNAQVFCCETTPYMIESYTDITTDSVMFKSGSHGTYWFYTLRVYINGDQASDSLQSPTRQGQLDDHRPGEEEGEDEDDVACIIS